VNKYSRYVLLIGDYNVLSVDWSTLAGPGPWYIQAAENVRPVAVHVSQFLMVSKQRGRYERREGLDHDVFLITGHFGSRFGRLLVLIQGGRIQFGRSSGGKRGQHIEWGFAQNHRTGSGR
jgi:hypothetical protein